MPAALHIVGGVIVVEARDFDETRRWVGADHLQKVRKPGATEVSNDTPSFNANVTDILRTPGQRLDLSERVFAGTLHFASDRQCPV